MLLLDLIDQQQVVDNPPSQGRPEPSASRDRWDERVSVVCCC